MLNKILNAVRNPTSLGERAINAGLWNIGGMALLYPLRLASNLIMTRLLAPEAFGLVAAVAAMQVGLMMFSDIGIVQSVMRNPKGDTPRYLRVAWVVQIIRGFCISGILILMGLVLMLFGPYLDGSDTVYGDPLLPWLMWAAAIGTTCKGFESTLPLLAQKRMKLRLATVMEVSAQAAAAVTMVALGIILENVWALVIGGIVMAVVRLVLSHVIFPGPPMRYAWDREQVSDMWSFGKWLIVSSFGGFMSNYGDRLIFSTLFDKTTFGVYSIAMIWFEVGHTLVHKIGGSTLVPTFSDTINNNRGNLQHILRKWAKVFYGISIAAFLGMLISSQFIFDYLYPPAYAVGAIYMQIICIKVLFRMFMPAQQYLIAAGDSRYFSISVVLNGVAILGLCYLGYLVWGVEGALFGSVVGGFVAAVIASAHRDVVALLGYRIAALHMATVVAACAGVAALVLG